MMFLLCAFYVGQIALKEALWHNRGEDFVLLSLEINGRLLAPSGYDQDLGLQITNSGRAFAWGSGREPREVQQGFKQVELPGTSERYNFDIRYLTTPYFWEALIISYVQLETSEGYYLRLFFLILSSVQASQNWTPISILLLKNKCT